MMPKFNVISAYVLALLAWGVVSIPTNADDCVSAKEVLAADILPSKLDTRTCALETATAMTEAIGTRLEALLSDPRRAEQSDSFAKLIQLWIDLFDYQYQKDHETLRNPRKSDSLQQLKTPIIEVLLKVDPRLKPVVDKAVATGGMTSANMKAALRGVLEELRNEQKPSPPPSPRPALHLCPGTSTRFEAITQSVMSMEFRLLVVAVSSLALIGAVLLQARRQKNAEDDVAVLERSHKDARKEIHELKFEIAHLRAKSATPPGVPSESDKETRGDANGARPSSNTKDVAALEMRLAALEKWRQQSLQDQGAPRVERSADAGPAAASHGAEPAPLQMTRQLVADPATQPAQSDWALLKAAWLAFVKSERHAAYRHAVSRREDHRSLLSDLSGLPQAVAGSPLSRRARALLAPVRDWSKLVAQVDVANSMVSAPSQGDEDALGVREKLQLLLLLTHTSLLDATLDFRLERWVNEEFIDYADQFLLAYQHGELTGATGDLERARQTVLRVLAVGNLRPIVVLPGETPFDSRRHVGLDRTSDPNLSEGVISAVVRNGFEDLAGKVVRQPEVTVNRR